MNAKTQYYELLEQLDIIKSSPLSIESIKPYYHDGKLFSNLIPDNVSRINKFSLKSSNSIIGSDGGGIKTTEAFKKFFIDDLSKLSDSEQSNLIAAKTSKTLLTIKNQLTFFAVLAIIGIIAYIISLVI